MFFLIIRVFFFLTIFQITRVDLTSNYLPSSWWSEKTKYNEGAIYRRIHEVHWHYEYQKYRRYVSDPLDVVLRGEGMFAMDKFMLKYRELNPFYVAPIKP